MKDATDAGIKTAGISSIPMCPTLTAAAISNVGIGQRIPCREEDCGWWDSDTMNSGIGRCAVLAISSELYDMQMRLGKIAHR